MIVPHSGFRFNALNIVAIRVCADLDRTGCSLANRLRRGNEPGKRERSPFRNP